VPTVILLAGRADPLPPTVRFRGSYDKYRLPSLALYADAATKFSLKVVDAQIEFETDAAGGVTGLVLTQNGQRLRALITK
jgi:hypothetical protein